MYDNVDDVYDKAENDDDDDRLVFFSEKICKHKHCDDKPLPMAVRKAIATTKTTRPRRLINKKIAALGGVLRCKLNSIDCSLLTRC